MNRKTCSPVPAEWADFKLALDFLRGDPAWRNRLLERPLEALAHFPALPDPYLAFKALGVLGGELPFSPAEEQNPYCQEYWRRYRDIRDFVAESHGPERYRDPSFARWVEMVLRRSRMLSLPMRCMENFRLVPIAFELSDGCRIQCPFCGVDAPPWRGDFDATPENRALWRQVLAAARDVIGAAAGRAPCYFATEPLDHPGYGLLLEDFFQVMGELPQTTTAIADREPERVRRIMALAGPAWMEREVLRFSLRSVEQLHRIAGIYTRQELAQVALLPQHGAAEAAYSRTGRARALEDRLPGKRFKDYSISCVAGFLVNMARRTVAFTEPGFPGADCPTGMIVHEVRDFRDAAQFRRCLEEMAARWVRPELPEKEPLAFHPAISLREEEGILCFGGDGIECRAGGNRLFFQSVRLLRERSRTLEELGRALSVDSFPMAQVKAKLQALYDKGYLCTADAAVGAGHGERRGDAVPSAERSRIPRTEVCLVMPPVAETDTPSLGLGLLKACLLREGISCRVEYGNLRYAERLGWQEHWRLLNMGFVMGEVVFAELAGISPPGSWEEMGERIPDREARKSVRWKLQAARRAAAGWLEETAERILAGGARIVGVMSSFAQHNAALALLRRLKEARPGIVAMMGGANCMGGSGAATLRQFPFVDYVFCGEADEIFPRVCRDILAGRDFSLPYGLLRAGELPEAGGPYPHRLTEDLEALPLPDYEEYFAAIPRSAPPGIPRDMRGPWDPMLLVEGSRGCWWGEKNPCTFCGLNDNAHRHRKKSPKRVARELFALADRYGIHRAVFSDSILSRECQRELPKLLLPIQAGRERKLELFAEVKSNLSCEEVRQMAEAGFRSMQPGIESLNDHVLRLMHKGNKAICHVALLKYARQYGMDISWNLLYNFPGERPEDYAEMVRILPIISHLQPPRADTPIAFHRGSVYQRNPEAYGLELAPSEDYRFYAPDDPDYVRECAYFFEERNASRRSAAIGPVSKEMAALVERWRMLQGGVGPVRTRFVDRLELREADGALEILDFRECRLAVRHRLEGLEREVYGLCRSPVSRAVIRERLSSRFSAGQVDACLEGLQERKLLLSMGEDCLALAVAL